MSHFKRVGRNPRPPHQPQRPKPESASTAQARLFAATAIQRHSRGYIERNKLGSYRINLALLENKVAKFEDECFTILSDPFFVRTNPDTIEKFKKLNQECLPEVENSLQEEIIYFMQGNPLEQQNVRRGDKPDPRLYLLNAKMAMLAILTSTDGKYKFNESMRNNDIAPLYYHFKQYCSSASLKRYRPFLSLNHENSKAMHTNEFFNRAIVERDEAKARTELENRSLIEKDEAQARTELAINTNEILNRSLVKSSEVKARAELENHRSLIEKDEAQARTELENQFKDMPKEE